MVGMLECGGVIMYGAVSESVKESLVSSLLCKLHTISPVSQSQRRIVWSPEHDTICRASAEKTARTALSYKGPNTMLPLCEFQTQMVSS